MVLKLYGSRWSPNAKRVALTLLFKKVPFKAIEVNMIGGQHKSAAYVKKQPYGEVPYIDDDGLIIYESRAICRYICAKYASQGAQLVPQVSESSSAAEWKKFALFEQQASVEIYNFDVWVQAAAMESVVKPATGQKTNKANYDRSVKKLAEKLDIYETILSKQKFLTGDELSLVDLFHIPYTVELEESDNIPCEVMRDPSRPNVERWWDDLLKLKEWKQVAVTIESSLNP